MDVKEQVNDLKPSGLEGLLVAERIYFWFTFYIIVDQEVKFLFWVLKDMSTPYVLLTIFYSVSPERHLEQLTYVGGVVTYHVLYFEKTL